MAPGGGLLASHVQVRVTILLWEELAAQEPDHEFAQATKFIMASEGIICQFLRNLGHSLSRNHS